VDALSTIVNAVVVAAVGILLAWYTKGRFDANDRRFARIEAKLEAHDARFDALDGRMASFEARMGPFETRMESFERSLDSLRSDLTRVALAVGAEPSAEAGG
jgi:chromosome segregation ATPase